jgi:N-acetylneuraminic acid mutarotase
MVTTPISTQAAESPKDNFWQYNLGIPENRFHYNAIAVNDKIYVFYYDSAIMYDPLRGNYSYIKTNPAQRTDYAIAAVGNKIYLMGGLIFPSTKTNINQEYNTQTDKWTPKTGFPQSSDYISANVVNGKIYVIGAGNTPVQVYNPSTDSWETKNPPPNTLQSPISSVIEDKIYVVSGDELYIYNTKTDSWSSGAKAPKAPTSPSIAATTGIHAPKRVYVLGGFELVSAFYAEAQSQVYVYDPAEDSWSTAASMLTPVGSFAVAVVNDKIYALGGWTNASPQITDEVQVYTPIGYSSTPLITSAPSSGSGGLSSLAVVIGVAIAAVVIAAVSITVIYFRHTPTKETKSS